MTMLRFVLVKLGQAAITFVLAAILIFLGIRALPGDPALMAAGEEATQEQIEAVRAQMGLDQPLVVQFFGFLGDVFTLDLGDSYATGASVLSMLTTALPVTIWLTVYSVVIAIVIGVVLGLVAERYRGKWPESLANALALLGLSIPNFWFGILAIVVLAVTFGLFPASGYVEFSENPLRALYYLTLPAIVLGTGLAAVIARQTRASMIETMGTDYVRTARAKGLSRARVLLRYGLRNSLIVLVTIVGLQLGGLISGAVVTERIFALPGIGQMTLDAVFNRDYPVIQAVVLVVTVAYIVINLAVDVLYSVVNPRIRMEGMA